MLSSIRKFAKSFLGKIVIGLIAIAFVVGFGMSGFTGKQNVLVEINNEKISSQEFVNYIQKIKITSEDMERVGKSILLERILMNFISEKIIAKESEKRGFQLSEKSLFDILVDDVRFKNNGKFSQIKYEKFMLSTGLTKPFYENLVKETEVKDQLLNFYSGGIKLPVHMIDDLYKKENNIKEIDYLSLTDVYQKDTISETEIKEFYEKNKNSFKDTFKKFRYIKLSPETMTGKKEFDEEFFKEIDNIENSILDGKSFEDITSKNKNKINIVEFVNSEKTTEDGNILKNIDDKPFSEIFKIEETKSPKFISHNNSYYIFEIMDSKSILLSLENKKLKETVVNQIKVVNQINKIGSLINDIKNKKFLKKDMIELANKNNVVLNTTLIKNILDDTKFTTRSVKEIYKFGKGDIFVLPNKNVNYLVSIKSEKDPKIDSSSIEYKKYITKANSEYISKVYKSYDKYINKKYKIDINNKVLKRIENSF